LGAGGLSNPKSAAGEGKRGTQLSGNHAAAAHAMTANGKEITNTGTRDENRHRASAATDGPHCATFGRTTP